jgi:uncharacterized membrane protein YcaP (DUF421 family)
MDLVLRAAFGFAFIFMLTRVVGRRELSSMEPFDLIMLVVIGDLVQQGITQSDNSVIGLAIVVSVIGLLTVMVAYLNFRIPGLRPVLEGHPIVLVENGNVIEVNLRRERLTVAELESEARTQQIDSLSKVRLAVLETSGKISFIEDKS